MINAKLAAENPFAYLNFLLQFAPPVGAPTVEKPLRAQFAEIGIAAGKPFQVDKLTTEQEIEMTQAFKMGLKKLNSKPLI